MTKVRTSPVDRMLTAGGVALEDAADAARSYSKFWTAEGARKAFQRARRGTAPDAARPAPLRRATYQREGGGARPTALAFDPAVVPPDKLRGWLEERVGPLARFAVEDTGGAPAPVLAAPGGAPAPSGRLPHPEAAPAAPAPSTTPRTAMPARPLDRLRLFALAERLEDTRPKREHGTRRLDWELWEAEARAAANLPSAEWAAWRETLGKAEAHR